MNNNKTIPVNFSKASINLLKMPPRYRKYLAPRDKYNPVREGEITSLKQPALGTKRMVRYIIRDEKDKETYQTEKFNEDTMPQHSSLILSKFQGKDGQPIYTLAFCDSKLDCFKHEDEKEQTRRYAQLDKALDARRKQNEYERVAQQPVKTIINKIPNFQQQQEQESSEEEPVRKNQHKLRSDSEDKPKKKVKLDESDSGKVSDDSVVDFSDD